MVLVVCFESCQIDRIAFFGEILIVWKVFLRWGGDVRDSIGRLSTTKLSTGNDKSFSTSWSIKTLKGEKKPREILERCLELQTKSSLAVQSGLSNSFAILRCRVQLHLVPGLLSSFHLSTWVTLRKVPGRDSTRPIFLWKKLMPVFAA